MLLPPPGTSLSIFGERHGQAWCIFWSPRYSGSVAGNGERGSLPKALLPLQQLHVPPCGLGHLEILTEARSTA